MLRMFSKFAHQALTRITFGYSSDATVAREEFLLSDSVSFGNVLQIRIQFYVTRLPLLSFLINTTPFPPDLSEFLTLLRVILLAPKHFLRNSLRTQTQFFFFFALHFFLLSPHPLFSQHKHRRILLSGYHSVE